MTNTSKQDIIAIFRAETETLLSQLTITAAHQKKNARAVNRLITALQEELITKARFSLSDDALLSKILEILYASYVVMLESRHYCWNYNNIDFSRRIGEVWEEFAKAPFLFTNNDISLYSPPEFQQIQQSLKQEIQSLISALSVSQEEKEALAGYYDVLWSFIDSGGINLALDLHFTKQNCRYAVDYKSGFGSNEKGNVNRLLLVASVYQSLPEHYKTLMFVRQPAEENNHYFQLLLHSGLWEIYCGTEAYAKIQEFTGFPLKDWIEKNINWAQDLHPTFYLYLQQRDMVHYLNW